MKSLHSQVAKDMWAKGWEVHTITLLQDLFSRGVIVRQGVAGITVLSRRAKGDTCVTCISVDKDGLANTC